MKFSKQNNQPTPTHFDTIIIGAGQAGLATSYYLKQQGRDHIIFEQAHQVASAWSKRWNSFTLITPNWMTRLPGAPYTGSNPNGFMTRREVVNFFEAYVERFQLPIRFGIHVNSVAPLKPGYRVSTNRGDFTAANVVVAAGFYQEPKIPSFSNNLPPNITQRHSSQYKNPNALPAGAVLVVGSAQSGAQIAEELYQCGRKVYLSVSSAGRLPRRYRGKDIAQWMEEIGAYARTVGQLKSPKDKYGSSAHGSGKDGGHTINLHQFARDGVILLGHVADVSGNRVSIAPDLYENLAKADQFEKDFVDSVDEYITSHNLQIAQETLPELSDGYLVDEILELDLDKFGISSVVWATGYRRDFSWVHLPLCDEYGYPRQIWGVTEFPGLYFIGLPFLHNGISGVIAGVGNDAEHIAAVIAKGEVKATHPERLLV